MFVAVVNWNKCTGCGDCIGVCPVKCFVMSDDKCWAYDAGKCIGCGGCEDICPTDAIGVSEGFGGQARR